MIMHELIAEGNRVIIRATCKGKHLGDFNGIPATYKEFEIPFVVSYDIENDKINNHWIIADQMTLMEQLEIIEQPAQ